MIGVGGHDMNHAYVTYHALEACSGSVHVGADLNRGEPQVHPDGKWSLVSLRTLQVCFSARIG